MKLAASEWEVLSPNSLTSSDACFEVETQQSESSDSSEVDEPATKSTSAKLEQSYQDEVRNYGSPLLESKS